MEMTRGSGAGAAALPAEVLLRADRAEGAVEYLNEVLPLLLPAYSADFATVTRGGWGNQSIAQAGIQQTWRAELVAECLDREAAQSDGPWIAAPLSPRNPSGDVLLLHRMTNAGAAGGVRPTRFQTV